jgi:uncharacterized delta-60 repeat protein
MLAILSVLAARAAESPELDNFFPSVLSVVTAIPQADGTVLIGGSPITSVRRVNNDGSPDSTFTIPSLIHAVTAVTLQDDGKILYGGTDTSFLGRLTPDGLIDTNFTFYLTLPLSSGVRAAVVQRDGRILIGGSFNTIPPTLFHMARLTSNGAVETAFAPHFGSAINCLALQADGQWVVGGQFTSITGSGIRNRMARLDANGIVDAAFNPNVSGSGYIMVSAAAVQPDAKVVFGGSFASVGGQPRASVARVLPDGIPDASFNPGVSGTVYSIALQADGKILLGGTFTNVAGEARENLARLNPDGSLDTSFTAQARGGSVSSVAIQPDGKVLVGGAFTNLASASCTNLGRLLPTDEPYETWTRNDDELTWLRGGGGPELSRSRFEYSTDGATWTPLGEGVRAPGGWKVSGLAGVPGGATIRGTGYARGGRHAGSGWWFQSTVSLADVVPLRIITEDPEFGIADGRFGFNISGPPGQPFRVEASTNLTHWTPVWTNTSGSNPVLFRDPELSDAPRRLYRVRYQ